MIWRNTKERYGIVARSFHWTIVLLIVGLLAVGLYMADLENTQVKFKLFYYHKSFGITVLTLAVLRLLWRLSNIRPAALPNHKTWERLLARLAHFVLYVAMLSMPLSGWLMSSAKGISVSVFGWFTLPDLVHKDKLLGHTLAQLHETMAWILIGTIALHAAGAIKHHFIDRDDTLRRMLPWAKLVFILALLLPAGARAQAPVQSWTIDPVASSLTFDCTQMNAPFTGTLRDFGGTIAFDPARLADSHAEISIGMLELTTGNDDRDETMQGREWLDTKKFPKSSFEAKKFEKTGDGHYIAHGTLTIRSVSLPVDLPFTLTLSDGGKTAKMQGDALLKRTDFGLGGDKWNDPSMVGIDIKVHVSLTARAA